MVTILHTVTLRIYIKCNKKNEYSCVEINPVIITCNNKKNIQFWCEIKASAAGIIVGDAFIIFFWLDVFHVVSSVCTVVNYLSGKRTKTAPVAYLLWAAVL